MMLKEDKKVLIWSGVATAIGFWVGVAVVHYRGTIPQPKPLQNVVCDTSYGVQYFEHKGILTLRVNHEGVPIRCFE